MLLLQCYIRLAGCRHSEVVSGDRKQCHMDTRHYLSRWQVSDPQHSARKSCKCPALSYQNTLLVYIEIDSFKNAHMQARRSGTSKTMSANSKV